MNFFGSYLFFYAAYKKRWDENERLKFLKCFELDNILFGYISYLTCSHLFRGQIFELF